MHAGLTDPARNEHGCAIARITGREALQDVIIMFPGAILALPRLLMPKFV